MLEEKIKREFLQIFLAVLIVFAVVFLLNDFRVIH